MSERSVGRALLRIGALTTAAVLTFTSAALAQEDPAPPSSSVAPTETTAPPSTSTTPPSSSAEEPPPPPSPTSDTPSNTATPPPPVEQPEKKAEKQPEAQAGADLKVTVSFERDEYRFGEDSIATVTVRNNGTAPATGIRFATEVAGFRLNTGVEDLLSRPSLAPGQEKSFRLGGTPLYGAYGYVRLIVRGYVEGGGDPTPNDNSGQDDAKVVVESGYVLGLLFEDLDGNGVADPGEGLAGKLVSITGPQGLSRSTMSDGAFYTGSLPVGRYQASFVDGGPGLWGRLVARGEFVVESGKPTTVHLKAVAPVAQRLTVVGYEFDKQQYGKSDPVSVAITLKNSGTTPLEHVVAVCDPEGDDTTLDGTGPGWAALNPDGPGITLAAGEQKTVTVTDVVPDAAFTAGRFYVACNFGTDGRSGIGYAGRTQGAEVVGAFGSVSGTIDGAAGAQVKIVALDPKNPRRVLGEGQSRSGSWKIDGLPQGEVALKVVGSWQFTNGAEHVLVTVRGGGETTGTVLAIKPGPEVRDPSVHAPDFKASVTFDRPSYDISDPVTMTLKVENVGTGRDKAQGSFQQAQVDSQPDVDQRKLSAFLGEEISLAPGESKQLTLTGTPNNVVVLQQVVQYKLVVGSNFADPTPENNVSLGTAAVTWGVGTATITVYGDRDLNGRMDDGEALEGRRVTIGGGRPFVRKEGTSDAAGKIRFTDLPAGHYDPFYLYDEKDGWVEPYVPGHQLVVNPGDEGTETVRLVRPLSDTLHPSITFDQPQFASGEQIGFTVTLRNSDTRPVQAKADCVTGTPLLSNDSADWGPLARGAEGVSLGAGETKTVHVRTAPPAGAADHGYLIITCRFGPDTNLLGVPSLRTTVKVPGVLNTFTGFLRTNNPNAGQLPVPGVKLVLLDPETGKPVARTVTDANGGWTFPDLPVGRYTPLVVGPWKVVPASRYDEPVANVRGRGPVYLLVVPGPEVADPDVVPPGPGGGGGGVLPNNPNALADTGVSVLGLTLFGALLVMAGAALRRRPVRS